ncbi:galactose-binding domain-like protein [Tuber brumale]|nr:galactose-binding domain-like protein [Tuber brumale]
MSSNTEIFGSSCIDLISSDLGGHVLGFGHDEWFDSSINPALSIRKPSVFVPTGAWYDGRHSKAPADWVIIKPGAPSGKVRGFKIDTARFSENHTPAVTAEGTILDGSHPDANIPWEEILTMQECGPSQRHSWKLSSPTAKAYFHVYLNMFRDGFPVFPSDPDAIIDLARVSSGAADLLLPGRGKDAGNGWETNRSRELGHVGWVAIKIGAPGYIEEVIVDTLHFLGDYPQAVEIYTINSSDQHIAGDASGWELIVPAHSCEADKEHAFQPTLFRR